MFHPDTSSLIILRVGDASSAATSTLSTPNGTALPTFLEYWDNTPAANVPWLVVPMPTGGSAPCTLGRGSGPGWVFDSEGLPSNTADGKLVTFPCYAQPPGEPLNASAPKTIAKLNVAAVVSMTAAFTANTGVRNASTNGWRQVASVDGSAFWTAGMAADLYGVRYLAHHTQLNSTHVYGQTEYNGAKGHPEYQAATRDLRGITIFGGNLYGSTSMTNEPLWAPVFQVGTGLPTASTNTAVTLRGLNALNINPWSFTFRSSSSLYVAVEFGLSGGNINHFETRPIGPGGTTLAWVPIGPIINVSTTHRVYSICGRLEPGSIGIGYVLYAATSQEVFRLIIEPTRKKSLAQAAPGTEYRGVAFPPAHVGSLSATPSLSASATPSHSHKPASHSPTAHPTVSRTKKAKP